MKNIHAINLNLLVVLDAILRSGSVTAAASQLHLSQSAVSHALRKLRTLFKDPLFVQQGHKLEPTALALELYPRVQRFVADAQELVFEPPRFDATTTAKEFHLAALDYLDALLLPKIYATMKTQSPYCDLRLHRPYMNDTIQTLEENPSFAVIGVTARVVPEVLEKVLWTDQFALAIAANHPLAKKASLSLTDFLSFSHALIGTGSKDRSVVDEILHSLGKQRRTAVVVPSFWSVPLLVSQSDLIVAAPLSCLRLLASQLPLKLYKPPLKLPNFTVKLYWHRRYDRDPAQKYFRQLITDVSKLVL
ncbi:MAG TPA: LysR family transcriptional regulator [Oligoflexus sp.]|uniref:LysR family transcriptional regulator n=1 Tax=Oligoflexus sp. TaxID=1971216 RepID=UPI002D62DE31|nr:LysR family transcriptional regulator [Oligoflexus sp.]HYX33196.1 LysR family transcriptional regulator [Oligoflexus sp.]